MGKATEAFKKMNLSQEHAQELVSLWADQAKSLIDAPTALFNEMSTAWHDQSMADPDIGPKLPAIKADMAKAFAAIGNDAVVKDFKALMDLTGAGNHPAFIKAIAAWGKAIGEGGHVSGKAPSPLGQRDPSKPTGSVAQAMYPNLPSAGR